MRRTAKETGEFIALMAKELDAEWGGEAVERWCSRIMRVSTTLQRLAEETCSIEMTEKQQARHEKKDNRAEDLARRICVEAGFKAVFQGDPRGAAIKIVVPSGKTNDWGQEGICVP